MLLLAAAQRGIDVFRFNSEDYPVKIGLTVDPVRPETAVLHATGGDVALGRAKGIWLRRPKWPEIDSAVLDPVDRAFAQQEAVAAIGGVWRSLAQRCVNPADVLQASRWKVAQLPVAQRLGFLVPESLVTSAPHPATAFASRAPTVLKAVSDAHVVTATGERAGETLELEPSAPLDGVRFAPILLQRRVAKGADVRATVVGRRVFAVRLRAPAGAPIDIRVTDPDQVVYEIADLGEATERRLLEFCDAFGLRFAAFDLGEDPEGRLWFFECNPGGQWAWLEGRTGLDMTGALIDLLLDPAR